MEKKISDSEHVGRHRKTSPKNKTANVSRNDARRRPSAPPVIASAKEPPRNMNNLFLKDIDIEILILLESVRRRPYTLLYVHVLGLRML